MNSSQPAIELLGFGGCPNTPTMRNHLTAALASIGKGWTFADIDQEAMPTDDIRRGYATPTILIDGQDLYGLPAPSTTSMGCRIYPGGVPDAARIASRIKAATTKRNLKSFEPLA